MIRYVRLTQLVSKQIKILHKGGGNAAHAAEHARSIVDRIVSGVFNPRQIGRLTKYGEARIPNCVKFDLVRGYRLIGILGAEEISFVFAGSHDECDHWLRNNAGLESVQYGKKTEMFEVVAGEDEKEPPYAKLEEGNSGLDNYDAILREISESDLRKIFRGICGKHS